MSVKDALGDRMKTYYESIPKTKLIRRTPVAIRLDGKAFHTFTKGFQKPFDNVLIKSMQDTMKYLCENIQGCVFGYTQSDEITLILVDYKNLNSAAWFDYEVQKMCSVAASMATLAFNRAFISRRNEWAANVLATLMSEAEDKSASEDHEKLLDAYFVAEKRGAMFDARVFNIPKEEVVNLIYWRQLDAIRNSIQMVGRANFSHRKLDRKSCSDIQDMLMTEKEINWNDFPACQKRGSCCVKMYQVGEQEWKSHAEDELMPGGRTKWEVVDEIPIFKGSEREYIESLIYLQEKESF